MSQADTAGCYPVKMAFRLVRGALHQMTRHHERLQLNIAVQDARWFVLSRADGVTVTTADESGVVYRKRDPP